MAHHIAVVLVALSACSCAPTPEPVGDALEPGLHWGDGSSKPADRAVALRVWLETHSGPCRDACYEAFRRQCSDADRCAVADAQPYDVVTCAGHLLTCEEVRSAELGVLTGLSACWRSCENLR